MSSTPAGWYTDPSGRFEQRYWDGTRWTEHVVSGGVQSVDRPHEPVAAGGPYPEQGYIGTQRAIFATGGAGPETGSGITGFLDRVGPDAAERPEPLLRSALAGLGGVVVAIGSLALVIPDDDPRVVAGLVGAALVLIGAGLRIGAPIQALKSAGTGLGFVGIPTLVIAITVDDGENGVLPSLLLAILFVAAWALPGYRGRNLFLGIGALALLTAIGTLIGDDSSSSIDRCNEYLDEGDFDSFDRECQNVYDDSFSPLPPEIASNTGDVGYVYLIGGAAYLGATWWLDRKRYRGAGTAFAAAGIVGSFLGTVLLIEDYGDYGGPMLAIVVGGVTCLVGAHGGRRATTWLGALLTTIGTIAFMITAMKPESDDGASVAIIIAGLALVGAGLLVEPVKRSLAARSTAGGDAPASDGSDAPPS